MVNPNDKLLATGEPVFHVFVVFDLVIYDFVERGIYTRKEDAEEHQRRHAAAAEVPLGSPSAGYVVQFTHAQLCHNMAKRRLGPLAGVLADHLGKTMPAAGEIVELRGNHSFPIAVARRVEG